MNNLKGKKWLVLGVSTVLLVLAMAAGFAIGQAMHTWTLSCGIWLVAAGLWLMIVRQYSSRKPSSGPAVSLLDGIAARSLKKVRAARPKVFKKQMRDLENQALRMDKKTAQIDAALKNYFGTSRISYEKFASTVAGVLDVYDQRVDTILKRIDVFDEDGYEHLFRTHQEYTDAMIPYRKTFDEIEADIADNEQILTQMDRLLREVSQLDRPNQNLADLPAMQELEKLCDVTPLYARNQNQ